MGLRETLEAATSGRWKHLHEVGMDDSDINREENDMTTATVDPRVIAEALYIGTDDLARMLTKWAAQELPAPDFDNHWAPTPLDDFDECVATARRYLIAAHAAMDAWNEDNPKDETE